MKKEDFILKKRHKIALLVFAILFFLFLILDLSKNIKILPIVMFLITLIIFYMPILSTFKKIPNFISRNVYFTPFVIPLLFLGIREGTFNINIESILLGLIGGLFLTLINFKSIKSYLSKENHIYMISVEKINVFYSIKNNILAVFGEEIFFRYYLAYILCEINIIFAIFISSILFAYTHYLTVQADRYFNINVYFKHFLVGVICSIVYLKTNSLISSMITHFIFNTPHIISIYKRYKNNNNNSLDKEEVFFDDYE